MALHFRATALCTEIIGHAELQIAGAGASLAACIHLVVLPEDAGTCVGQTGAGAGTQNRQREGPTFGTSVCVCVHCA